MLDGESSRVDKAVVHYQVCKIDFLVLFCSKNPLAYGIETVDFDELYRGQRKVFFADSFKCSLAFVRQTAQVGNL